MEEGNEYPRREDKEGGSGGCGELTNLGREDQEGGVRRGGEWRNPGRTDQEGGVQGRGELTSLWGEEERQPPRTPNGQHIESQNKQA